MHSQRNLALFLSAASTAMVVAQSISDIPTCAAAGALAAIGSTGCSSTDIACICKSQYFTSGLQQYAKANCSPQDYNTVVTVGQALCAEAGVIAASTNAAAASMSATVTTTTMVPVVSAGATVTTTECACEEGKGNATATAASVAVATWTGGAAGAGALRPIVVEGRFVAGIVGALGLAACLWL